MSIEDKNYFCLCNTHVKKGAIIIAISSIIFSAGEVGSLVVLYKSSIVIQQILSTIIAVLVIVGILMEKSWFLLPYLVLKPCVMFTLSVVFVYLLTTGIILPESTLKQYDDKNWTHDMIRGYHIGLGLLTLSSLPIYAYFLLVVFKAYKFLRDEIEAPKFGVKTMTYEYAQEFHKRNDPVYIRRSLASTENRSLQNDSSNLQKAYEELRGHGFYYADPQHQIPPLPGRDASSLSPMFPFTTTFNNGLDVNPGRRVTVEGNLNVPILGWGMWDYKGGLRTGNSNTRVGFGTLVRPTNTFGISPETIETLASDPTFNKARSQIPSIPVSVLPGNFVPLRCKPPFCNPFLHNTAFGVDVEPGDDYLFDGGLDFPLPLAPSGVGVRIPVSGGVSVGTDPLLVTYGHGLGPAEPPNFKSNSDRASGGRPGVGQSGVRSFRLPSLYERINKSENYAKKNMLERKL